MKTIENIASEVQVLLLEIGGEEPEAADVPAFAPMLQRSSIDWNYMTQAEPQCCTARPQGRCPWPRGRVMGGTSVINYMIYLRGGPRDFDEWAEMGNPGWSYKEIFPYFLKIENNRNIGQVAAHYHGSSGEWTVEYFPYQDANVFAFLDAFEQLGYKLFDQNTERQVGASLLQHSTRNGQRLSANVAFIRPIRNIRRNLVIQNRSFVIRVLINPYTKTAYGVEYLRNGRILRAYARKEVIVSAGVMMSPKVLMLSGVGPAEHLDSLGITVVKDLPVGRNLHDHTTIDGVVFALTNITSTEAPSEQIVNDINFYRKTLRGPLSGLAVLQVNSFVQTKYETEMDRPDIQFSIDSTNLQNFYTDPILMSETNVLPLAYYNSVSIRPVLLAPKSRGTILLNSTHPIFGDPLIYAGTFTDPIDIYRILDGIRIGISLLNTKAMRDIGATLVTEPLPACKHLPFNTDEYWICIISSYTGTLYHPSGTCKMGPARDKTSVVDHELRVHGVKNLRVIDNSIMPVVTRANTNTATLMIAEKGCDFIKGRWLKAKLKNFYPKFNNLFREVKKMLSGK